MIFKPTVAVKELESVLDPVACPQAVHLLLLLYEGDEGGPFHLHGLTRPDQECQESQGHPHHELSTDLSYRAMTKWKKFDFLKFAGGCFSKWALPMPGALKYAV